MTTDRAARSLVLMHGGWISLTRGFLIGEGGDEPVRVPVPIALVDTADGYVLFDTGMNCEGIRDPDGTWGPRCTVEAGGETVRVFELRVKPPPA